MCTSWSQFAFWIRSSHVFLYVRMPNFSFYPYVYGILDTNRLSFVSLIELDVCWRKEMSLGPLWLLCCGMCGRGMDGIIQRHVDVIESRKVPTMLAWRTSGETKLKAGMNAVQVHPSRQTLDPLGSHWFNVFRTAPSSKHGCGCLMTQAVKSVEKDDSDCNSSWTILWSSWLWFLLCSPNTLLFIFGRTVGLESLDWVKGRRLFGFVSTACFCFVNFHIDMWNAARLISSEGQWAERIGCNWIQVARNVGWILTKF
jgi:hypothetical protein